MITEKTVKRRRQTDIPEIMLKMIPEMKTGEELTGCRNIPEMKTGGELTGCRNIPEKAGRKNLRETEF